MKATRPYPVEAAALCQPLPEPDGDSQDALSNWAASVIDLYVDCAKRHRALSEWARGR